MEERKSYDSIEQVTKELQAHTDDGVDHNISDSWKRSGVCEPIHACSGRQKEESM